MKKKIGLLLEENIVRLAQQKAAEEGRRLSDLIQDALHQYSKKRTATPRERRRAFHLFCERPMKIPFGQLRYVFKEDLWDL